MRAVEAMAQPMAQITIEKPTEGDIPAIIGMVSAEAKSTGALLPVSSDTLRGWISSGLSYVAKHSGTVVGHEAAHIWPKSGWIELRSAVVKPEYRGMGIGSRMSAALLEDLRKEHCRSTVVAFTNMAGKGKGILKAHGFREIGREGVPEELFTIGPKHRGKSEFGYKIFVLTPS